MALATIGAILGAAGSVASGIMSAVNNKKLLRSQQAEAARQQAFYESKANEDTLSKASSQRLLNAYDTKSRDQLQAAQGVAAVTGATPEYSLAVQKGIASGRASLMGDINANQEASTEKAVEQAEAARQASALAQQQQLAARDQSLANLASNSISAAGSMISGMQPKEPAGASIPPPTAPLPDIKQDAKKAASAASATADMFKYLKNRKS